MRKCLFVLFALCCWMIGQTVSAQEQGAISDYANNLYLWDTDGGMGIIVEPMTEPESNVVTFKGGDMFVLTATTLRASWAQACKLAVALVRDNTVVDILSSQSLSAVSGTIGTGMIYFTCKIKDDTEVKEGDEIRLLTTLNDIFYFPVPAYKAGTVVDRIPAVNYEIPVCHINYDANIPGVSIRKGDTNVWADKAVRGRNFYLYIEPDDPETVVVVKANGISWIPSSSYMYALIGVVQDYDVDIKVYPKGVVDPYKEIECSETVRVKDVLTEAELNCLKGLRVTGYVKNEDFPCFCSEMPSLELLDLSDCKTESDYIPERAFEYNATLHEVKLPKNCIGMGSNAFRYTTKLEFVVLPEGLAQFGFNEFFGSSVKTVWVKWDPIKAGAQPLLGFPIPACAFRSTLYKSEGTLIVPKGCVSAYKNTSIWGEFKTIREPLPIDFKLEIPFSHYLSTTGVGDIMADGQDNVTVVTQGGKCRILQSDNTARKVEVFDAAGMLRESRMTDGTCTEIGLHAGFYVVRVAGKSHKVLVP